MSIFLTWTVQELAVLELVMTNQLITHLLLVYLRICPMETKSSLVAEEAT